MPNNPQNSANGFRAVKLLSGGCGSFPMFTGITKSNLSLTPGDALIVLTSGLLDLALTASTKIVGVCQNKITAIAATRQNCRFIPAMPNIVFSGKYKTNTAFVQANVQVAGISIAGATGVQLLSTGTVSQVNIVQLEAGSILGSNARVLFIFRTSQWTGQA